MFETLLGILPHAFQLVGAAFSVVFMVILLIILVAGARKINVTDLFSSAADGGTSLTKFWQNIAYAAATIAFLAINIAGQVSGASLEMIWMIYLGIIGSNAVLSKWISLKYNRTEEKETDAGWSAIYPPQRRRRGAYDDDAPTRDSTDNRVDNPDGP